MNVPPIRVTDEGVLIPLTYLHEATEFEWELRNGHVLIRPKTDDKPPLDVHTRFPWIGIGTSSDPSASERVEEILAEEVNRRSGFTMKPPLDEL